MRSWSLLPLFQAPRFYHLVVTLEEVETVSVLTPVEGVPKKFLYDYQQLVEEIRVKAEVSLTHEDLQL